MKREKKLVKKIKRIEKEINENIINLPNFFTTLRVIITFIIIYMVFAEFKIFWIALFFIAGMITDFLDGNIARIFNMKTEFGRKYDMAADRFLFVGTVASFLIYFGTSGGSFFSNPKVLQIICIMTREIIGVPFAVWAFFSGNITPRVKLIGKVNTVLQAIAFPSAILSLSFAWPAAILTGIVGLICGIVYARDTRKDILSQKCAPRRHRSPP